MSEKGTPSPAQGSPPSLRISDAAMTIYPCDGRQACVDRSVCSLPAWKFSKHKSEHADRDAIAETFWTPW
jgi:hypothetical protein